VLRTGRFVQTDRKGKRQVHVIDDEFVDNAVAQFSAMKHRFKYLKKM
jgi:hypothetical protein